MTELKLEVGKTYRSGNGRSVLIAGRSLSERYPFICTKGVTFTSEGKYNVSCLANSNDLVYEEKEPAQPAARTPHKWAKEMHAFADGYEIESLQSIRGPLETWRLNCTPLWSEDVVYRIKPEPAPLKPNSTVFLGILENGFGSYAYETSRELKNTGCLQAIRIEFNPNDQTLVSAEVVTL